MRRNILRGGLAVAAAFFMAIFLILTTKRPVLHSVVVVTKEVAAGSPVLSGDLGTVRVKTVPKGALTDPGEAVGAYAQTALYPGETLSASAVGRTFGFRPGLVRVTVPVSAAQSGLVSVGDTVDVLGYVASSQGKGQRSEMVPLASGVEVVGVFTSSAAPVGSGTGSSKKAPALVSLAVTPDQAQSVIPFVTQQGAGVWFLDDPSNVGLPPPVSAASQTNGGVGKSENALKAYPKR